MRQDIAVRNVAAALAEVAESAEEMRATTAGGASRRPDARFAGGRTLSVFTIGRLMSRRPRGRLRERCVLSACSALTAGSCVRNHEDTKKIEEHEEEKPSSFFVIFVPFFVASWSRSSASFAVFAFNFTGRAR
jgi:hypothetical protein